MIFVLSSCTNRWVIDYHASHGHQHEASQTQEEARVYTAFWKAVQQNNRQATDLVYKWQGVANCESGGNWYINTGNGYFGGVQFSLSSWRAVGGTGYPHQNSPYEQASRAERLKAIQGLGAWPHCGRYYRG